QARSRSRPKQKARVNIALPSPTLQLSHGGFAARDLLSPLPGTDSLLLDLDQLITKLADQNYLRADVRMDVLGVGLRFNNLQVSLTAAARAHVLANYPKEMLTLAWQGNAAFLGQSLEIGPELAALAYSEIALGGAYRFNNFTIGARFKYLNGLANAETGSSSLLFSTDEEYYQLRGTLDYTVETSLIELGTFDSFEPRFEIDPFTGNSGFAIDLGATYSFGERLQISASLLDFGSINWNDKARSYRATGEINFEGIDAAAIILGDSTYLDRLQDSLQNQIQLTEEETSYRTVLPMQMMAGVRFSPLKKLHINGLLYNESYRGQNYPGLALGVSKDFGKVFTLGASYNIRHRAYNQLGLQMWLRLGPFAGFLVMDNVLAPILPMQSKYASLRLGMNLAIGRIED
ncbi:MAG: DUF5723 family protein, partial [Bacteroidota bacterium]